MRGMPSYQQTKFPAYAFPLEAYDGQLDEYVDACYATSLEEYAEDCDYNRRHGLPIEDPPEPDMEWARGLLDSDRYHEFIEPFMDALERFNAHLKLHQVILDSQNPVVYDLYRLRVVRTDADRYTANLPSKVLSEEALIRDWLCTVPEMFGFEPRYKVWFNGRKPRASGRR